MIQTFRLGILLMLLAGLLGCGNLTKTGFGFGQNVPIASIRDLQAQGNTNNSVSIKGKVVNIAPLVEHTAYQVQDSSGSIWVLTTQTPPKQGDEVAIEGMIKYQSIPIEGIDFGEVYLQQKKS